MPKLNQMGPQFKYKTSPDARVMYSNLTIVKVEPKKFSEYMDPKGRAGPEIRRALLEF